jgi:aspartyl-tRNA(Asn)/glutamyl-tRNA(Gln) amidotransferase subunit A
MEELHELLVKQELTVVELIESVFAQILKVEDQIGAFISYDKEYALAKAKEVDERGVDPDNLLDGLPVAVKDNIVTKDFKTTAASIMLEDFVSVYDATVVEKLQAAGMIIVGKVNMDEFAMGGTTENSKLQLTRNPWDTRKVPGGSSGGSAAAVAAGMVPATLGSDTGGSIRQPASYSNLVGIKPTYGTVSRYGVIAFASSLDQVGPLTRTVKDNAVMLNTLSGKDEKDGTSADVSIDYTEKIGQDIKGLKIGVPTELFDEGMVTAGVLNTVKQAVTKLEELGAEIIDVSLPDLKYSIPAYYAISSAEASSNLQRFDGIRYGYTNDEAQSLEELYVKSRSEGFGTEVKKRIILGGISLSVEHYDALYGKATKVRTLLREEFDELLEKVDFIIGPTAVSTAPLIGETVEEDSIETYYGDILTTVANLIGAPALNIPAGFSEGMPVGMQFIGNYFDEATLYQVAHAFEQATDHHKQFPEIEGGEN